MYPKTEVNGLMSNRTPMTNGIPQRLLLGQVLFNIFVSYRDSGIQCSLSHFANDTGLCGVIRTLEGSDAIQRGPDRLENRAHANVLGFNKANARFCIWFGAIPSSEKG